MSTYIKRLQFYVKSVVDRTSNKQWSLEKSQDFSQVKANQDTFRSPSSNVPNVDTSTQNLSHRKFNPLTDTHSGLHEYE